MNYKSYFQIIVLTICSYSASGQIELLKDINDQPKVPEISVHRVEYNGFAYYSGNNGITGSELWRTDGTPAGTGPVKDIYAGSGSSSPSNLTVVENILYFSANDGVHGKELWRSDGTETGTYMVVDINEGAGSSAPAELTYANGVFYFTAFLPGSGVELWSSDGTSSGTAMVADLNTAAASSSPDHIIEYDSAAYFIADDGSPGVELWKTDGTASGTALVGSLNDSVANATVPFMVVLNSRIFFGLFDGSFYKAWTSDGTSEGTFPLSDVNVVTGTTQNQVIGDYLYFAGSEGNSSEYELWRTDATSAHTELVATINPHEGIGSLPSNILAIDSVLYFAARATTSSQKFDLYKSTGAPGDYTLINDGFISGAGPSEMTNFKGQLCFRAADGTVGWEFYVYNGESLTVHNLAPHTLSFYPHNFVAIPDGLIFSSGGSESSLKGLWKYDGSTVMRIAHSDFRSSNPTQFIGNTSGVTFFVANDGINGQELWRTDGTTNGTFMVKNIHPTGDSAPADLTIMGNMVFFAANDGLHGLEVWKSDGTEEGTVIVTDIVPGAGGSSPSELTVLGNVLFFEASAATGLNQLWKSVAGGTATLVKNLPGAPYSMTALAPYIYFRSFTGMAEPILDWSPEPMCALWRSDGTDEGTIIIRNLTGCNDMRSSRELIGMGSNLYFQDGPTGLGTELWKYNGTEVSLVRDINPGGGSYPGNFAVVGNTLFFGADDGVHGYELWQTDGTTVNTMLVKDINPGPATGLNQNQHRGIFGGEPRPPYAELAAFSGKLYFAATDGSNGWGLWTSDGTVLGTVMMNDIMPWSFQVADSSLYFITPNTTWAQGRAIYVTNGTACGTREVKFPSSASWPESLTASGNKVYASAFFQDIGREPMVIDPLLIDPVPPGCPPEPMLPLLTSDQRAADPEFISASIEEQHTGPYPNPFSESIIIPFTTKNENTFVRIVIYDLMGRRVAEVVNETFQPGYHEATWQRADRDGNKVTKGIYLYKLQASDARGVVQGRLVAK